MNSLTQWDPFKEMASLPSLFRLPSVRAELKQMGEGEWAPAVDLAEDDENYTITADLPDVKKEDINISIEDGYLTLSGERHHESEDKDSKKKYQNSKVKNVLFQDEKKAMSYLNLKRWIM